MMRNRLMTIVMAIILIFSWNNTMYAQEKPTALLEYDHDVTGDGVRNKITLYGIPFESNSKFYQKVWAEIELRDGKKVRIDYEGGYEPKLEFADLNHDGVDDILYSSATGGSGGLYNYALHTLKDAQLKEIPLPEPLQIEGAFQNDFKAIIEIPGIKDPIVLDLSSRKDDYISLGLFQKNGMLNEPTELMIDPIAFFEIVKVKNKKGYGLKGYRQISGAYHADGLGTVETTWYYENGKWNPVKVEWKTSE
ncbi:hypothetical protein [Lederbergia lenta]|uniref:Inner spore coat protein n=2 Tax=Lederbergia lenta TaxID=1467 RepID=A0A2X4ZBS6_LEDLE|nr:hypothetical protein [Lederbergia lenta]SQI61945.1 inner spore coat protein [Lederbergia lenta]